MSSRTLHGHVQCILTEHVHLGGVIKVEVARSQTHSQPLSKALPEWRSPGRLCVKRYTTCQRLLLQPRAYNGGGGERVLYLRYTAWKLKMQSQMTIRAYSVHTCTCTYYTCMYALYKSHVRIILGELDLLSILNMGDRILYLPSIIL